ncbi:AarF/UbiB family protein [Chryseobacterium salipaludis]|uniref:ABC1 kinase family protein n=1 Tax=Chryseobacterium TaxID=59732 RepID=UPI001FF6C910|nr:MULTISPECIES: AarF/UbiB family protein [Chryseobacterium]MCJ8497977.1 AarF/UbiB family protein [Chryseobacterium salipaludis]MCX3296824.1 AarF/UbiB family protein [Planobacterium sp. JC490]
MKSLDRIPVSKIERAAKILQTGAKVGVNYLKYYGDQVTGSREQAREQLDRNNASDIYDSLKQMKGSALKVAQMLSMEKNMLPTAYVEKFSLAQFQVPPLSAPLVDKMFSAQLGKRPQEFFDTFNRQSTHAASIGQVHEATKNGRKLAVKIQYPGVAESISSDLAMVKPLALKLFNIKAENSDRYFREVEGKLLEETDYRREIHQSMEMAAQCVHLPNLRLPQYYPQWSSSKIITMDWMEGIHLAEFTKQNRSPESRALVSQTLWDFYMFQIHGLHRVHADPHPGNFLVDRNDSLIALDFGCMKHIPAEFYNPYFALSKPENLDDPARFEELMHELELLSDEDSEEDRVFFSDLFHELFTLFFTPFRYDYFDFRDAEFLNALSDLGQKYAKSAELRNRSADRGSRHFIYMNRTFFGLYSLMNNLHGGPVRVYNYQQYLN